MKVWITQYALTAGIQVVEGEVASGVQSMFIVPAQPGGTLKEYFHGEGRNWHRTFEGAVAVAEAMRRKKIASLQKQISKLEKLSFGGTKE